ncbi:MAG: DUF4918 family protein [Cyclobacteriaceae bacterium]|nr:DUF4918 family protein [Cyclobacteriaceae bacterium]
MTWAEQIIAFNQSLKIDARLPKGVAVLNPFTDSVTLDLAKKFYFTYYNDNNPRTLILGINPGRFGAGLTGVPFTDPKKLEERCDIANTLPKKAELSADFIWMMIDAYGGPEKFFGRYYISSISPLGFTRNGKNLNYYDDKGLEQAIVPFAVNTLHEQIGFGLKTDVCYCLGEGKNIQFLSRLNEAHHFFKTLIPLPHPRFIMQYRRKKLNEFLQLYTGKLG